MERVFLIPGFFGFTTFGELKYFAHVREVLDREFKREEREVTIHYVETLPTASLTKRASRLATAIDRHTTDKDVVHLVGHSTGGLDARLLCAPRVALPFAADVEPLARRVKSVVTVASPHHGAPQAGLFTSLLGQNVLKLLSMLTLHGFRLGSFPLPAIVALAGALPRLERLHGPVLRLLDQFYSQLLRDFDQERQREVDEFFQAATREQTLLPQLSPECMQVFNASVANRDGVRYGCVITRARPPSLRTNLRLALSPTSQAMYALYRALYELASELDQHEIPRVVRDQAERLREGYGELPPATANDAIVPTWSQLWGEIIHTAWADHHDVIGHFDAPDHDPPHTDWLSTATGFNRHAFEKLWRDVCAFLS